MEKNVPLLKLIHDPWSIKTMLSSVSLCILALRPTTTHPASFREAHGPKRGMKVTEEGLVWAMLLPVCVSPQDVLLWFPVSQLWEGAGALETAGIFIHPQRQNRIDGSLKSPQERRGEGAGRGLHSLIPIGSRRSDPAPPLTVLLRWQFSPADFPILLLYLKNLNAAL